MNLEKVNFSRGPILVGIKSGFMQHPLSIWNNGVCNIFFWRCWQIRKNYVAEKKSVKGIRGVNVTPNCGILFWKMQTNPPLEENNSEHQSPERSEVWNPVCWTSLSDNRQENRYFCNQCRTVAKKKKKKNWSSNILKLMRKTPLMKISS